MEKQLLSLGLSKLQATLYLYLLRLGKPAKPSMIATKLELSRTNTYKLLDSLYDLGLVYRTKSGATLHYSANDPSALSGLASQVRNEAIRLERLSKEIIPKLKDTYAERSQKSNVTYRTGKSAVYTTLLRHAKQNKPNYFLLTNRHDIALLGFDAMDRVRRTFAEKGLPRFGITHDTVGAPKNPAIDKQSNLTRTWIEQDDYTAPVEWSVSGDELLIVDYSNEGAVVQIENAQIAHAFRELWRFTDGALRRDPRYKALPKLAQREE